MHAIVNAILFIFCILTINLPNFGRTLYVILANDEAVSLLADYARPFGCRQRQKSLWAATLFIDFVQKLRAKNRKIGFSAALFTEAVQAPEAALLIF